MTTKDDTGDAADAARAGASLREVEPPNGVSSVAAIPIAGDWLVVHGFRSAIAERITRETRLRFYYVDSASSWRRGETFVEKDRAIAHHVPEAAARQIVEVYRVAVEKEADARIVLRDAIDKIREERDAAVAKVLARGIEAEGRDAPSRLGAQHESPVAKGDAPAQGDGG